MRIRLRAIRLRTMLMGIAALALVFAAAQESVFWLESRKFVDFHEARARQFLESAARWQSSRPDVCAEYHRLADWHVERAAMYRKAHTIYFSKEGSEDIRQTEREQTFEQALNAVGGAGDSASSPPAPGSFDSGEEEARQLTPASSPLPPRRPR